MISSWNLYQDEEEYQKNLEGSKALNTLFGHNKPEKREKPVLGFGPGQILPKYAGGKGSEVDTVVKDPIFNIPQTRKPFETPWIKTVSDDNAEDAIKDATQDSAVNLETDRSIAATNARSSLLKAAEGTERRMASSSSKGSIGQNLLTLQQMRNEQTPIQTVENAAPTSTPSSVFNTNIPLDLGTERIAPNLNIDYTMPKDFNAGAAFTNKGLQNLDLAKAGGKGGLFANAKSTANTLGAVQGILEIASNSQKKEATPSISPAEGIDEEFRFYIPNLYA